MGSTSSRLPIEQEYALRRATLTPMVTTTLFPRRDQVGFLKSQSSLVGVTDGANQRQLSRFLGYVNNYKGGFNVAAGDYDLDGKADIFLGAVNSGSSADFFSGQVRIFSSKDLPQNAGSRVIDPNERIQAFSKNTKGVGIHLLDADRDGVLERMDFTVQRGGDADDRGRVQRRSPNAPFGVIDNIFANASLFGAGMEV
jgi:hypothetical protein